ncbi:hypothetical protein DFP72DRAFT_501042 [Ephemerocybe angulata]|uniref:Uncharacterized protein n=1 Tax=Ephemerocybe angulata TaxID=980116 RepID=A0A8H6HST1_9AGAR|nr:hypothetical protein DFP72DRAFT_501042 [Tulosesus angulatus]
MTSLTLRWNHLSGSGRRWFTAVEAILLVAMAHLSQAHDVNAVHPTHCTNIAHAPFDKVPSCESCLSLLDLQVHTFQITIHRPTFRRQHAVRPQAIPLSEARRHLPQVSCCFLIPASLAAIPLYTMSQLRLATFATSVPADSTIIFRCEIGAAVEQQRLDDNSNLKAKYGQGVISTNRKAARKEVSKLEGETPQQRLEDHEGNEDPCVLFLLDWGASNYLLACENTTRKKVLQYHQENGSFQSEETNGRPRSLAPTPLHRATLSCKSLTLLWGLAD